MAQLIDELFVTHFDNEVLRQANDQAAFDVPAGRLVMSTDGHVISPLFFPAATSVRWRCTVRSTTWRWPRQPLYLSAGFILEEVFRSLTWNASSSVWVPRRKRRRAGGHR